MYVVEIGDNPEPIGVIRFDLESNSGAIVSINLAPQARGRGVGQDILSQGCALAFEFWTVDHISAQVRYDNEASESLFRKAGFVPRSQTGDFISFELARSTYSS